MSTRNAKAIAVAIATFTFAAGSFSFEALIYKPYIDQLTVDRTGGYWSDLYPAWYATREVMLHRRNPYSTEVTREIEIGFTGKPNSDPKANKNGFVYPLFISVPLSPCLLVNFVTARRIFFVIAPVVMAISVLIWANALQLKLSFIESVAWILITLSSFPVLAALVVQQLAVFALPLLGLAFLFAQRRKFVLSGMSLAFSMFKPQLTVLPALLLLVWAASRRERSSLAVAFGLAVVVLWSMGEALLQGWVTAWLWSLRDYAGYTAPTILRMILGPTNALVVASVGIAILIFGAIVIRKESLMSERFLLAFSFALAFEMIVTPNGPKSLFNHLMLLPVVLILWKCRRGFVSPLRKILYTIVAFWFIAPWIAATIAVINAIFVGVPAQPTFAPFNIALFFPIPVLSLIVVQTRIQRAAV